MAKPAPFSIPFAVIGGSGAYNLLSENSLGQELACERVDTPFGKSAPIHRFRAGETEFLFLSRHGEKDYSLTAPFVNYRANLYALKDCGAEQIVSWSGPGIVNTAYRPGEFVLPHDVIDETRNRPTTFFEGRGVGFIRQSEPFCPRMRLVLHDVIHDAALPHHEQAVYACTEGPRLESPAEIRKLRILGADLVGMTLLPETFLARELEICYASICYLTNYAEGVVEREFREGELFEGMQNADERSRVENSINNFPAIIKGCFERMKGEERNCNCKEALRRYKNKGMIGEDWRSWF